MRKYNSNLENHFIVATWDQRGTGRSYTKKIAKNTMTLDQIKKDSLEVTNLLREMFSKEKILLIGHSSGTSIGLELANDHPELFHAYIGMAQIAHAIMGEEFSYSKTLELATQKGESKILKKLHKIGKPINGTYKTGLSGAKTQRQLLTKLGGFAFDPSEFS